MHPFLPQHELVKYCQSKGIVMQAYSPLGSSGGPVLQDSLVQSIAKAHNADPAQVVISWAAQRGVVALPKSVTPSRIETNRKLIELSDDEMLQLNELHKQDGKAVRLVKPNVSCISRLCSSSDSMLIIPLSLAVFIVGRRPRMVILIPSSRQKNSISIRSCSVAPFTHHQYRRTVTDSHSRQCHSETERPNIPSIVLREVQSEVRS